MNYTITSVYSRLRLFCHFDARPPLEKKEYHGKFRITKSQFRDYLLKEQDYNYMQLNSTQTILPFVAKADYKNYFPCMFPCVWLFFLDCVFITPPRNCGGVIFSPQFVCVCVSVCLCICPIILVNNIPAERMHRFGRGFR